MSDKLSDIGPNVSYILDFIASRSRGSIMVLCLSGIGVGGISCIDTAKLKRFPRLINQINHF